jgi:hypothetical protein
MKLDWTIIDDNFQIAIDLIRTLILLPRRYSADRQCHFCQVNQVTTKYVTYFQYLSSILTAISWKVENNISKIAKDTSYMSQD